MAEGYTEARKQMVRQEETLRREFIEDLLRGDADVGRLVERAELFGLDMGRPHQVALAAPTGRLGHADTVISTLERAVVHRCRGPLRPGFGAPTASVTSQRRWRNADSPEARASSRARHQFCGGSLAGNDSRPQSSTMSLSCEGAAAARP